MKKKYDAPVTEVLTTDYTECFLGQSKITFDEQGSSSLGDQTEVGDYQELPDGQTPLSKQNHWGDLWDEY